MKTSTLFKAFLIADAKREWFWKNYPKDKHGNRYADLAYKLKLRILERLEARND